MFFSVKTFERKFYTFAFCLQATQIIIRYDFFTIIRHTQEIFQSEKIEPTNHFQIKILWAKVLTTKEVYIVLFGKQLHISYGQYQFCLFLFCSQYYFVVVSTFSFRPWKILILGHQGKSQTSGTLKHMQFGVPFRKK